MTDCNQLNFIFFRWVVPHSSVLSPHGKGWAMLLDLVWWVPNGLSTELSPMLDPNEIFIHSSIHLLLGLKCFVPYKHLWALFIYGAGSLPKQVGSRNDRLHGILFLLFFLIIFFSSYSVGMRINQSLHVFLV
jgi:hypothetical protein